MLKLVQCTLVSLCLASGPAPAFSQPAHLDGTRAYAADLWLEFLVEYLELLERFLWVESSGAATTEERIQFLTSWYCAHGVPPDADADEGRGLVRDTYYHVKADPGQLDAAVREQFLYDLRVMYAALGGDPGKLGSSSP